MVRTIEKYRGHLFNVTNRFLMINSMVCHDSCHRGNIEATNFRDIRNSKFSNKVLEFLDIVFANKNHKKAKIGKILRIIYESSEARFSKFKLIM